MVWSWFRYICLMISLSFIGTELTSAQWLEPQRKKDLEDGLLYNECVYIISNYSSPSSTSPESLSLNELLEKEIEGFYFYLRRDAETNALSLRNPDGSFMPFSEALAAIKHNLDENQSKIMTLFLDFYVYSDLEEDLKEAGLLDYLLEYDTKRGWPSIQQMLATGQRLVLFEVQPHFNTPAWLHLMSDHVEHTDPNWGNYSEEVLPFDSRLKQSLLLFTGFKNLESMFGSDENITAMARQTPYLIESFKQAWITDGKIPNFILVNKYYSWLNTSMMTLRNFHIAFGIVTNNGELLNYVNWEGMSSASTGRFYFPLEPGAQMTLTPSSPGYKIEPTTVTIVDKGKKTSVGNLQAKALRIDEGIELYLPFSGDAKDISSRHNYTFPRGVEYMHDPIRGEVGLFENEARVDLPTATKLLMKDHDFTVGVWIKIPKYLPDKDDYCVLGSKNGSYQQTLHFLIRNKKPYMGFFNNDLVGHTTIDAGEWYHIVWRYNKSNNEQAIFVNGKLDAISTFRPAFRGTDSLYVGYLNMGPETNFEGMIDNLCIWSRVLSDKEILGLSNQLMDILIANRVNSWWAISALIVALFIAVGIYLTYHKRKTIAPAPTKNDSATNKQIDPIPTIPSPPSEKNIGAEATVTEEHTSIQQKNYIRLFGEFYVLDRDGNDITALFTPKLKQLFILILLHSSRGEVGISGSDLSRMIWKDDGSSAKSTRSLRSVSILKLRKILERIDHVEIVYASNKYLLQLSKDVYCDYLVCLDLLEKHIKSMEDFDLFLQIISGGEPFKGESFDWLDDSKSYICNNTVDVLSHYLNRFSQNIEADKVIQITDQILINDPCNEEALTYKIKALNGQNKFRLAHYAYDRFCSLYQEMYGEPFAFSYEQISSFDANK